MQNLSNRKVHIGLLCAMPEEIGNTIANLKKVSELDFGDLKIFSGEWCDKDKDYDPILISVAWSGWGKVSAARAATRILSSSHSIPINLLLFTGVAGAAKQNLSQWDVVIPNELIQYDMDSSPFFQKYVIPALNKARIQPSSAWVDWASSTLIKAISEEKIPNFGKVENSLIATGDSFISDKSKLLKLKKDLPELSAVEMEGAAVAQVAEQENINWLIIRVISDDADESASQNFTDFLRDYQNFSWKLIEALLKKCREAPW